MKRALALLLALCLVFALAACGQENTPATDPPAGTETPEETPGDDSEPTPVEVVVFAAASMEATLTEIAELYKEVAPWVTLTFTFDSSGTLKTQIEEGAVDCGVIYATDAFTYELNVVDQAAPEMCDQVIYPAAVMKSGTSEAAEAAQAFLDFIHTDAGAVAVLEGVGFTVL